MAYSAYVFDKAKKELENRRAEAQAKREANHSALLIKHPEILQLEQKMAQTGLELIRAIAQRSGADNVGQLKKINLDAQRKRLEIIKADGLPEDYLETPYTCKKCEDTGFTDGLMCQCHKKLLKSIAYSELCRVSPMKTSDFEDFSLDFYPGELDSHGISPKKQMHDIASYCLEYAKDFSSASPSLLFCGATGLGKTHLSLAIANKAINGGHTVVYGSVQNLLNRIESEHFGRGDNKNETLDMLLCCDLLILDDLGAEFSTQFTVATIYNIVNTRMLTSSPVIISTNLTPQELEDKYDKRITSRIIGGYVPLLFCGKDIRQLKKSM